MNKELPFGEKILLVLVGITNWIVGGALYYLFKDKKPKEANILKVSSIIGFFIVLITLIIKLFQG